MSKMHIPVLESSGPLTELQVWRQDLLNVVLRILTIAALPVIGFGFYYLYQTQIYWMMPVALIAYAIVLIGAFVRGIPYVWRAYGFLAAIYIMGVIDLVTYGWGEDSRVYLIAFTLLAAIFLGNRAGFVTLGISAATLLVFVVVTATGLFEPIAMPGYATDLASALAGLALLVMFCVALLASLNDLFPRLVSALEKSLRLSKELEVEKEGLVERTRALQEANLTFQRRAMYLDASIQVAQVLATLFDVDTLLEKAANLITEYFDFYHTGIFLMDETEEWAVLRAASSTGGRRMLGRGHRLRRGSDSMVGWAIENRQPRIAADVGEDAVYFANPDLLATRSEMTLPLIVAGRLVGVLDVQSTEESAFDQDDIRALQGLAGQLAVAINNAQRLTEEASVLEAASPFYRLAHRLAVTRTERDAYATILETVRDFDPAQAFILRGISGSQEMHAVAEMRGGELMFPDPGLLTAGPKVLGDLGKLSVAMEIPLLIDDLMAVPDSIPEDARRSLALLTETLDVRSVAVIPIYAETEWLGTLVVWYTASHRFTPLEARLYRVLADLGGVALERTELVQQAETRLERERWIRQFGEQVLRIPSLEAMIVEAAQSLQEAVRADGVVISLVAPEDNRADDRAEGSGNGSGSTQGNSQAHPSGDWG